MENIHRKKGNTVVSTYRVVERFISINGEAARAGEAGRAQVTYDSWFGVNLAKSGPDILSADEFRRSRRATDYGYSTDWYDLLLRDFSYDNNQYLSIEAVPRTDTMALLSIIRKQPASI